MGPSEVASLTWAQFDGYAAEIDSIIRLDHPDLKFKTKPKAGGAGEGGQIDILELAGIKTYGL